MFYLIMVDYPIFFLLLFNLDLGQPCDTQGYLGLLPTLTMNYQKLLKVIRWWWVTHKILVTPKLPFPSLDLTFGDFGLELWTWTRAYQKSNTEG